MQAVGRLGSYISKGVYTVSGTFHPFGGAVDIIVVVQPDGSYKSSPWYVRFGKFQGVLKSREKLVRISVNGEEAGFYMHLDSKGEAFFVKEVDTDEESAVFSPSSGEDTDGQYVSRTSVKSKSCNNWSSKVSEGDGNAISRTNSRRSQIFGRVFGGRGQSGGIPQDEHELDVIRSESMDRAEMAADLLELRWSTNLASPRLKKDIDSQFPGEAIPKGAGQNVQLDVSTSDEINRGVSPSCQEAEITILENLTEIKCLTPEDAAKIGSAQGDTTAIVEQPMLIAESATSVNQCLGHDNQNIFIQEEKISTSEVAVFSNSESHVCDIPRHIPPGNSTEESLLFGELEGLDCREAERIELIHVDNEEEKADSIFSVRIADGDIESSQSQRCSNCSVDQFFDSDLEKTGLRNVTSDINISKIGDVECEELTRTSRSLPSMLPISTCCDEHGLGSSLHASADYDDQSHCIQPMSEDMESIKEQAGSQDIPIGHLEIPPKPVNGSRRGWPFSFKRSRSVKVSPTATGSCQSSSPTKTDNTNEAQGANVAAKVNMCKKKIITRTPTSEQLASLNLKEGKNVVIFTFSTAMLGNQQVDARIFLWRWDSRIVISDVDGTITRSDLLGQVMPLVGMDWSQTGVAHFFSAIKENGYQLLFLSARSISQAFHTRQFLFNIKQDGKALPEGPVVISPDGLFPSLFREVVRRAPHEFKIACLEDIKALFPADRSPFYAGFGNRDTDEFSYLKVGIPKNKIFIINPKGEIVVNRRVDTKSYLSLHTLVHGMFPIMSTCEEEDFNTWNYWKLPPLDS